MIDQPVISETPSAPPVELAPDLWPRTASWSDDGALQLGGCDVRDLAAEFGTPLFILDDEDLRCRCSEWLAAFGDGVYYAGKAFLCVELARIVAAQGLGLDVCTGGELAVARAAGFPMPRVIFHGNNKSEAELAAALEAGVGRIVVDSFEEIARLAQAAGERGLRQQVLLRITPGVEAHTHTYVATGQEDQKFGFSLAAGAAAVAIERVLGLASLELVGLHAHIGSQIFDTQGFALTAHRMVGLLAQTAVVHHRELAELNLGGGLGIAYTAEDAPLPVPEFAARLKAAVGRECEAAGIGLPKLSVEPGRAIVGPTTVTVYEVGTVKELPGLRTYVSVDGGMSDNIRTALYGAHYTAVLASRASAAPGRTVTVAGKHCESGDLVVSSTALPADLAPTDLIAIPATGAYHRSMASNYNHVPRPAVVAVAGGAARLLLRRETEADLLRLDVL